MKWPVWFQRVQKRDRRIAAVIGGVLLAAIAILVVQRLSDRERPRGQARIDEPSDMGSMAGMEGMAGMDGDGSVSLTAGQIREFGITFSTVEQRPLQTEIRTTGIVGYDETRMAIVTPKFSGFVEALHVDFTGKPVRRGQPLLDIYSPELVAAQEELLLAVRLQRAVGQTTVPGVEAAPNLVAAARARLRLWDIRDEQIEEVLRAGRARRTLTLFAPVNGVVVEKNLLRGQSVQAGEILYKVADLSEVWIDAQIRESDAGAVTVGATATVELTAFPGRPIPGRVEYVYPSVQEEARVLRARIAVANPAGRLLPGMYATVRITSPGHMALTVPTSAVINTGERRIVFVDMGGGRIMPHQVETGSVAGDRSEVLFGLEPGQRVVTSAQFLLDSESNLADVMRSMIGQGASGTGSMQGMDMPGMKMGPSDTSKGATRSPRR